MTAPMFDPPPPEPRRKRSAGTWIILLIVWLLGIVSFLLWSVIILYLLIKILG